MMESVYRHEGTVNQVMGNGIMTSFGALLANEDRAMGATYAPLTTPLSREQDRRRSQIRAGQPRLQGRFRGRRLGGAGAPDRRQSDFTAPRFLQKRNGE